MRENPNLYSYSFDMLLSDNGPIISVLSSDKTFVEDVELLYENLFKSIPKYIVPSKQVM